MPWPSLMWQQWTAGLLGMSSPLGCRESRAAAQLGKICYWNCGETKKISFKQAPNTLTFQEVQFSTGSLQLLLILHNSSCILPFKENTFVTALQFTCKERNKVLFSCFFVIPLTKRTVPLLPLLSRRNPLYILHIVKKFTSPFPFSWWEFMVAW